MLQSVGIRPKDLSRIDFAAELKSRVGGNVNVDVGSGRKGGEVGNDGSVPGSGTDKGRVGEDGEPARSAGGRRVLGYVKDGKIYLHESVVDADTPLNEYKKPISQTEVFMKWTELTKLNCYLHIVDRLIDEERIISILYSL